MITKGFHPRLATIGAKLRFLTQTKWLFSLLVVTLLTVAAAPPPQENTDEQYIRIMTLVDKADALRASGQADAARAKYKEAQIALTNFKRSNPLWNAKTVAFRLNEVAERAETKPPITELAAKASPAKKPEIKPEAEPGGAKSAVKLLNAGAEPRKVLRLHVKSGDQQLVIMTMKMSMEMPGAGTAGKPMKIPTLTLPVDVTIKSVAPNGDITYESVLGEPTIADEPGVAPQMAQAMKTGMSSIKGLTSTGVMSSRGISKKVDVKAPPGADAQIQQAVEQMKQGMSNLGVPTPEEAVGPGAKWEVKSPIKSGGMSIDQTASYELISADGDHVSTSFTLDQTAGDQRIQNPAMGAAQLNLIKMTGSARGTATSDLSRLISSQANLDMHMEMNSEVTIGNKKQPIDMKMDMNFKVDAK